MRMMIGAVLVLAVAAAAPGQEQTDPGRAVEAEPDELILAGPKVETARLPGLEESFSGGAMRMPGMGERPVPMRVFRRVFAVLRAASVAEQLRLPEAQHEQLRELGRERAQAARARLRPCTAEIARPARASATRARPVGTLRYRLDTRFGLKDDVIFCFDLDCGDFVPAHRDGQVEDFTLWPVREAMARVAEGDACQPPCARALIELVLR